MGQEERRKRHELSYGVYNFRDVKMHFSRLGWTYRPGPPLSYDHYYIKPGKNPRNKDHKQGVDYFLGEAELVAYARKKKIFGEETLPVPVVNGYSKRRARSSSTVRTSQLNYADSDSESRRDHKRHRRRSGENKVGSSAQNPIALFSDSSDDDTNNEYTGVATDSVSSVEEEEWTEGNTRGGFDKEEDEDEEEEEEEPTSSLEEETNDEPEDDDLEIDASSQRPAKPPHGKSRSHAESQEVKRRENGKAKAKPKETVKTMPEARSEANRQGASDASEEEELGQNYKTPRPLLTTSHRKRSGVMHTAKRQRHNDSKSLSGNTRSSGNSHGKKRAAAAGSPQRKRNPLAIRVGKKAKSAPRSLLENTDSIHDGGCEDDNSFELGVAEYGESPPRRPPSKVNSRANSVRSSPATSVVAASPPPPEPPQEEIKPPAHFIPEKTDRPAPDGVPAASHSILSSSTTAATTPTPTRSACAKGMASSSAQESMELTQVVLPPDCDNKYHIRVTVSADKPPVHTIWLKNLSSHEQHQYSFVDVMELPGAKTDLRVPTAAVLTALFRCLSSQPDAVVIVGPEPRSTAESKATFEKGEVQLLTFTAEKNSGDTDGGGNGLTLVVAYPALDLFRVDHNFPMKLVSADHQVQHLEKEVERLREQLTLVQTDRDKLCEQLRQQEEENERTLSQQVEAQVKVRIAAQVSRLQQQQSSEEMESRVAKLVEKNSRTLQQAQEKEKRNRDRARRWVSAQSDWMSTFQPCRALIAGATADTATSLLRPGITATMRKYVVEWKEVVEIAEQFFQPTDVSEGVSTRSITVVKSGVYRVNANVSHDSLVQLRLVITPSSSDGNTATPRDSREIAPTKVSLYDNKRRVSRVDTMLELHALDQLSLELRLLNSIVPPSSEVEEWLRTPMPTHNRLLVVVLDEHAAHV